MSAKGKDDAKEIVNFEALELEGDDEPSQKMTQLLTYLKENMEPDKYAEVMSLLGGKDLTNSELLDEIKALMKPKKEEEEEEEDDAGKNLQKDGEKPDRAAFMKQCMEGGKTLEECTEEFKKKYPEPAKEEGAKTLEIPEEIKAQLKALEEKVTELTEGKELAEVSTEVEKLVSEKALAPIQRDAVIKMSAKMPEAERAEFFDFFRKTQKITAHTDVGILPSSKPGGVAGNDLTIERKKELIEMHGLDALIEDKADRTKLKFLGGNN